MIRLRMALLLGVALAGCPDLKPSASKHCTKAYAQCTLDSGVLGVCDQVACEPNREPPCLVCRSQH